MQVDEYGHHRTLSNVTSASAPPSAPHSSSASRDPSDQAEQAQQAQQQEQLGGASVAAEEEEVADHGEGYDEVEDLLAEATGLEGELGDTPPRASIEPRSLQPMELVEQLPQQQQGQQQQGQQQQGQHGQQGVSRGIGLAAEPRLHSSAGIGLGGAVTNTSWRMAKWMRDYVQLLM
jgi:hypothetical protein